MTPLNKGARRLLVLGAGALHEEYFKQLRLAGFQTIGMDREPMAAARDQADSFVCADPSDTNAVAQTAARHSVTAILALSEHSVLSGAMAAAELGLGHLDVRAAKYATDKALMRQRWTEAGIDQPKFEIVQSLTETTKVAQELGLPLILKPRHGSAARGVTRVNSLRELASAFSTAIERYPDGVVVERIIEGIEASVEGWVTFGNVVVLAVADKALFEHPHYCVTRSINYPGDFNSDQRAAIESTARRCITALGIDDSPFHLEVFVSGERVVPIECGARPGGGPIGSHIVRQVSGVDFVGEIGRMLCGERPLNSAPIQSAGACYRFLDPPAGRLDQVEVPAQVWDDPGYIDLVIAAKKGDSVGAPDSGAARAGFLVTRGNDRSQAMQAADRIERMIRWQLS